MKPVGAPQARHSQAPLLRASLLICLVLLSALAALPSLTWAGWLPPAQLTDDNASSLLSLNNARCLAAGDSDRVYLVWCDDRDGDYDIYYKYFNGSSWSPEVPVTSNSTDSESPSIAVDATGGIHLVWSDVEGGKYVIYYKSYDGNAWSQTTKLSGGGMSAETPVVAIDKGGKVHVVWREYQFGDWALYYRCFDGTTWSTAEAITPSGAYPRFPSITADGGDSLEVVWQDARIPTNSEIYYRRYNGTAWEPEERLTNSAGLSEYPSVTADSVGKIHVFWDDNRGGAAAIYHKVNDGTGWSADEVIATDANNLIGPSCCAGAGADLHLVWRRKDSTSWNGVDYSSFDGAAWSPPEEVAQAQGSNLNPCVAWHSNGRLDFAWQDARDGDYEIWWRFYQESAPTPVVRSVVPSGWLACETSQVLMSGENFVYGMRAWLAKSGEDSIPAANVTAPSPAALSCQLDLGPAASGYWDVVVEAFDGGRDTLQAGFLVEPSLWSADTRLTVDADSSALALGNATKIAVDSHGRIHVVWYDRRDGQWEIYYKRCDGGTWEPDTRLTTSAGNSVTPAIAVDSADRLYVVWSDDRDGSWAIYYKQYDGVSWGADQRLVSAGLGQGYPAIAVDGNDNIYVAWQYIGPTGGSSLIYLKRFDGSVWEPTQAMANTVWPDRTPAVAADAAGSVHVVWYEDRRAELEPSLLEYRKFNGFAWEPPETLVEAPDILTPSIAVGPNGSVHVCWRDKRYSDEDGSYEIFYKRYEGAAWGPDQRLTQAPGTSDNPSIAVAPDGVIHVVWADWRWGNAEIYHSYCDERGWTLNGRLTKAPDRSDLPSVACDAEGNAHVVWMDHRDGNSEMYYKTSRIGTLAGVDGDAMSADQLGGQVYQLAVSPNPAPSGAVLRLVTRQDARVRLSLYDVRGRLVWSYDAGRKVPGSYDIPWDGCDSWGRAVSPGTYFARLTSGRGNALTKVVVVK
ncbi:MAG TPA: FlgD immunoglobulin-like domain containing protein [bacterium]|nr:FlgD immunoglobulin-like domain containing protein [bacterium]